MVTTPASYRTSTEHLTPNEFAQQSALSRDIEALCAAGMLEAFDDDGVIRYRPIELARAA